jgi:hypothetical protein
MITAAHCKSKEQPRMNADDADLSLAPPTLSFWIPEEGL